MKSFRLQLVIALVLAVNVIPAVFLLHHTIQNPPRPVVAQAKAQAATQSALPRCGLTSARECNVRTRRALGARFGLLLLFPFAAYVVARSMARAEAPRGLVSTASDAHAQIQSALREGTRGEGDFVILEHLREDLGVTQRQLIAGLNEVLEQSPVLEHREVAGTWILRQPRL